MRRAEKQPRKIYLGRWWWVVVVVGGDYRERTSTFSIFSREYTVHSTPVSLHKSLIGLIVTLHGLNEQTLRLRLTTSEPGQTARHVGPHHPPLYLHQLQCQSEDDFHRPQGHITRQNWTGGDSELFIGSTGELYSLCSVSVLQVPQLSGLRALQRPHLPGRQLHPGQLRGAAL